MGTSILICFRLSKGRAGTSEEAPTLVKNQVGKKAAARQQPMVSAICFISTPLSSNVKLNSAIRTP